EFAAGARVAAEGSKHGAGHRNRVLLLHAAHRHAEMLPFEHHADTDRTDFLENGFRDLVGEPLLDLETSREDVDEPWDLAQTHDLAVRDVGDVALAEERQQVVLAEAVEVNVLDD